MKILKGFLNVIHWIVTVILLINISVLWDNDKGLQKWLLTEQLRLDWTQNQLSQVQASVERRDRSEEAKKVVAQYNAGVDAVQSFKDAISNFKPKKIADFQGHYSAELSMAGVEHAAWIDFTIDQEGNFIPETEEVGNTTVAKTDMAATITPDGNLNISIREWKYDGGNNPLKGGTLTSITFSR